MIRETGRWTGILGAAFLAAGAGILAGRPAVLLAGAVGVGYAAYAAGTAPPSVDLALEREVSEPEPDPGEAVTVTVRIRNEGGALPDLRLVDGVPDGLVVTGGSPRHGTALRGGKTAAYSYTVEARRGEHAFGPLTVIARDASGAHEREVAVEAGTTVTCVPRLPETPVPVPLRAETARYAGPVAADVGGEGSEFFATREYHPTDAIARVDWNRLARTGELATVEYREERSATVVLLIDAREAAYVETEPHAVERGIDAARYALAALLSAGHRVGVGAVGAEPCWLAPATGRAHREAARRLLAVHPALSPTPPATSVPAATRVRDLRRRLPENAQVLAFTPLVDDEIATLLGRLEAFGYAPSVVTPDVTREGTPGQRLAGVERDLRLRRLRADGIRTIDVEEGALVRALAEAGRGR